jgi:hypothetical protein
MPVLLKAGGPSDLNFLLDDSFKLRSSANGKGDQKRFHFKRSPGIPIN